MSKVRTKVLYKEETLLKELDNKELNYLPILLILRLGSIYLVATNLKSKIDPKRGY